MEKKDQFEKHDFITGKKSFSCLQTENTSLNKDLKRQKLQDTSLANIVERVSLNVEVLLSTREFIQERSLSPANTVERVSINVAIF